MREVPEIELLDGEIDAAFTDLYRDLGALFPHPFEWTCLLVRPRWWRRAQRRAYWRVWHTFIHHGFVLRDDLAGRYFLTAPQGPGEDCGGACVRRLRSVWEYQIGSAITRDVLDG